MTPYPPVRGLTMPLLTLALLVTSLATAEPPTPQWEPFSPDRVELARERQRPVMVFFHADWSANSVVIGRTALYTPKTTQLLETTGVLALVADWTHADKRVADWLNSLGRQSIPTVALYLPNGETELLPELLTDAELEKRLLAVGRKFPVAKYRSAEAACALRPKTDWPKRCRKALEAVKSHAAAVEAVVQASATVRKAVPAAAAVIEACIGRNLGTPQSQTELKRRLSLACPTMNDTPTVLADASGISRSVVVAVLKRFPELEGTWQKAMAKRKNVIELARLSTTLPIIVSKDCERAAAPESTSPLDRWALHLCRKHGDKLFDCARKHRKRTEFTTCLNQ